MFNEIFKTLQKSHNKMLDEYVRLKMEYAIESVTTLNIRTLPVDFIEKRKSIIGSSDYYTELKNCGNKLSQNENEVELDSAINTFLSIDSMVDFAIFLDLSSHLHQTVYATLIDKLLSDNCITKLRHFLAQLKRTGISTNDVDDGYVLTGNITMQNSLLLLSSQISSENEVRKMITQERENLFY